MQCRCEVFLLCLLFLSVQKSTLLGLFKSVSETLVCDHSNKSYSAFISYGAVKLLVFGDFKHDHLRE